MTYAPESLLDLRAYLQPITGLSPANLGIVGDADHQLVAVSYHLGRDQLDSTAYSRRTLRDAAGLTNAASAMDIGNYPGLRQLSIDLVRAGMTNEPGTRDIREIIYSPDGKRVLRWDRERGYTSLPREGEADSSHLWHTHISWYRDSEQRDKIAVFRAITGGSDVPGMKVTAVVGGRILTGILRITVNGEAIALHDRSRDPIPAGAIRRAIGPYTRDWDGAVGYVITEPDAPAWVSEDIGTFTVDPPPVDCTDAIKTAVAIDRGKAHVSWD